MWKCVNTALRTRIHGKRETASKDEIGMAVAKKIGVKESKHWAEAPDMYLMCVYVVCYIGFERLFDGSGMIAIEKDTREIIMIPIG